MMVVFTATLLQPGKLDYLENGPSALKVNISCPPFIIDGALYGRSPSVVLLQFTSLIYPPPSHCRLL